jgi:Ca2+-transporting ATPase
VVTRGRGDAVVTGTAYQSALGRIARLLDERRAPLTPLQGRLGRLGRQLSVAATLLCALVAVLGLVRGEPLEQMLITAVSLAVAAIPESLPAVVSLSLALGAQRMAARGALVRHLPAVETLGSVTVIASDKTGTLTEGTMAVQHLWTPSAEATVTGQGYDPTGEVRADGGTDPLPASLIDLLVAGVLCNDAELVPPTGDSGWTADGDPTEAALLAAAARAALDPNGLRAANPRVAEVPFDSIRARMSTANRTPPGQLQVICKGSPESVLDPTVVQASAESLAEARRVAERYATEGQRVLAVAASTRDVHDAAELETGLRLVGLMSLADPLRPSALVAVTAAREAGIRPVVITGDHPATVASIATRLGILTAGQTVLNGRQLASDPAARAAVYARTAPEQKLDIVTAWQSDGNVVAMTGDGVNDAPALKAADIGVAMGITGTDVSKEAADIVLADDNFASIVAAVEEGRAVFSNIRKFLRYLLSSNIGEVLTMFFGVLLADLIGLKATGAGVPLPLVATQILWINLVTDGAPALALGIDPAHPAAMQRPPRPRGEGVITGRMWAGIVYVGVIMAAGTLLVLDASLPGGLIEGTGDMRYGQTMAFTTLVLFSLFTVFNARSDERSAFADLFSNRWLWGAVLLSLALQAAVVYTPFLQQAFSTVALSAGDWLLCAAAASTVLWLRELSKLIVRA